MSKIYTEQQEKFLSALPHNFGNIRAAMDAAGYSQNTPENYVIRSLKDEIIEIAKNALAGQSIRAVVELQNVLNNPHEVGVKNKIMAIKEILDRAGIVKEEKISISGGDGVIILPAKVRREQLEEDNE
jgi:hypothetical protein